MPENFGRYNDYIENIDVKGDQIPDSTNENLIKDKARSYVEKRLQEGITGEDYEELLQNIEATRRIIQQMEQALEKMPDLKPGENGFILRGDKQKRWSGDVGSEIELKSFTSVSNNRRDIFLGEPFDNDTKVLIIGKDGRVKDISSLAMIVNFGDKFKGVTRTSNEGIILPNSSVRIIGKGFEEEGGKRFNKIITEQTK